MDRETTSTGATPTPPVVAVGDARSLGRFQAAVAEVTRIVAGVGRSQWQRPTVCERFDVEQLMRHMVAGLWRFADGQEATTGGRPVIDLDQMAGEYRHASTDAVAAGQRARPTDIDRIVIEQLVHGWDLALATGQSCVYDDGLVLWALDRAGELNSRPHQRRGLFDPPVAIPEEAPPIERLVAFLGRARP